VQLDAGIAEVLRPILEDPDQAREFARQLGDLVDALARLPDNDEVDMRVVEGMRGVVRQVGSDGVRRHRLLA
jgi:hypothetical protein